jgi:hypothetical protein
VMAEGYCSGPRVKCFTRFAHYLSFCPSRPLLVFPVLCLSFPRRRESMYLIPFPLLVNVILADNPL